MEELINHEVVNGLGFAGVESLFGKLQQMTPERRVKSLKAIARNASMPARGTSREEFVKRMEVLDENITKNIVNGSMRLADVSYYATKHVGGLSRIKMLDDDQTKVVGTNNISRGMLEKDNVLLLDTIVLISGVGTSSTSPADVAFGIIPAVIRNGQHFLKANGSEIIPISSNENFNTTNMTCRVGEFKLANPVLVQTQKALEFELEWASAAVANTWVRLILMGTVAYKK